MSDSFGLMGKGRQYSGQHRLCQSSADNEVPFVTGSPQIGRLWSDLLKKSFEVYRRQANGSDWLLTPGRPGEGLVLQGVELTIPADLLFEDA